MSLQLTFYKSVESEGMFKVLPNGSLGRCYLLRSNAGDCIEITCLPVTASKILDFLNFTTEETWKLHDMFEVEFEERSDSNV